MWHLAYHFLDCLNGGSGVRLRWSTQSAKSAFASMSSILSKITYEHLRERYPFVGQRSPCDNTTAIAGNRLARHLDSAGPGEWINEHAAGPFLPCMAGGLEVFRQ